MAYEKPPNPGKYYIKSVAAPKNVIEVPSFNEERAVCSLQSSKPTPNQQWYIQHSGKGYKIKNVQFGVYLSSYSPKPKNATPVGTSLTHGPADWHILRTHDGFAIQYGEDEKAIDLHCGLDISGNPMHLWDVAPQHAAQRWKFERISDDVGGEAAETVEDRISVLCENIRKKDIQIAMKDAEIFTKDRLLARKEQELQEALQTHHETLPNNVEIQSQMDALRNQMERLELLVQSSEDHPEQRNNAS